MQVLSQLPQSEYICHSVVYYYNAKFIQRSSRVLWAFYKGDAIRNLTKSFTTQSDLLFCL